MQYTYCIHVIINTNIMIEYNRICIDIITAEEYLLFLVHGVENGVTYLVVTRRVSYVVSRKKKTGFQRANRNW